MIELHQLECFYLVASLGSFTKAADELYITQPAVSSRIKALEEEFDVKLFERSKRDIFLTPYGEVLLKEVGSLKSHLDRIKSKMDDLKELKAGKFSFGTSDIITTYLLPDVLAEFTKSYPYIEVTVIDRMSQRIVALVEKGELDFGIVSLPVTGSDLVCETLLKQKMVLIASKKTKYINKDQNIKEILGNIPVLMFNKGSHTRKLIEDSLKEINIVPNIVLELGTCEIIKRYVRLDFGVTFLPELVITDEEIKKDFIIISSLDFLPDKEIGLIYRKSGYRSRFVQKFLGRLESYVGKKYLPQR